MRLLFVMGTRPEAIKLAPLVHETLEKGVFDVKICSTGQHRELLDQAMDFFVLKKDYDLDLMGAGQSLDDLASRISRSIPAVYEAASPDCVIVQGDTTTAMTAALVAFHKKIRIAHVEAGLRSGNPLVPFPEEMNRRIISLLASFHFCPTELASLNLEAEGIRGNVFVTGNTGIDALRWAVKNQEAPRDLDGIDFSGKTVLVTLHRRESFGQPIREACEAILELSERHADIQFIFPVHLNPNVRKVVAEILGRRDNVHLLDPLDYPSMVWVLQDCFAVLTDSGGIQEEACSLGKPTLVMRDTTERQEGVSAGISMLVGYDRRMIMRSFEKLLDPEIYKRVPRPQDLYGDGKASFRIHEVLRKLLLGN
jgi:UDP-N-acetylglucosamine 2-epimerase (non-hydrolysing)